MDLSEKEWKERLGPDRYAVMRQKTTEPPFSGKLLYNKENGVYVCAACGFKLFSSDTKFDSLSGWPSFNSVINNDAVRLKEDFSLGMHRIEVMCKNCGSHLGHVFNDAPDQPTGMRFCINSIALSFEPAKKPKSKK